MWSAVLGWALAGPERSLFVFNYISVCVLVCIYIVYIYIRRYVIFFTVAQRTQIAPRFE